MRSRRPYWAIFLMVWTGMCLIPIVAAVVFAIVATPPPDRCGEGCGMAWIIPAFVIYAAIPIWLVVGVAGVILSRRGLPPRDDDGNGGERP